MPRELKKRLNSKTMKRSISPVSFTVVVLLMFSACGQNNIVSQVQLDNLSIVLPEPFSQMNPASQIRIAMSMECEENSLDNPISDTTSNYLKQVASSLTGMKHLKSEAKYIETGEWELYRDLKDVWLTYQYETFDESYGDTQISPARINLFAEHHSAYMAGKMKFPKWEFRKLMQGPNYYWAVISNHSYTPVSYPLELEYLMECGLEGLKSIKDVADVVSPDGRAGLLSFDSDYNNNFSQSIILLEGGDGIYCNMWFIDKQGYIQSNHYSTISVETNAEGGTVYKFSWDLDDCTVDPAPERRFFLKNGRIEERE